MTLGWCGIACGIGLCLGDCCWILGEDGRVWGRGDGGLVGGGFGCGVVFGDLCSHASLLHHTSKALQASAMFPHVHDAFKPLLNHYQIAAQHLLSRAHLQVQPTFFFVVLLAIMNKPPFDSKPCLDATC